MQLTPIQIRICIAREVKNLYKTYKSLGIQFNKSWAINVRQLLLTGKKIHPDLYSWNGYVLQDAVTSLCQDFRMSPSDTEQVLNNIFERDHT